MSLTLSRSCLSYVVLLVLLVPPGPRWARFVRSPQAGAPRVAAGLAQTYSGRHAKTCMHSRVLARVRARIFLMKGTEGLLARARRGGCGALIMQWALFAADRSSLPRWRARPRRGWAGGLAAGLASLDAAAASPPRACSVLQLLFECSACTVCATAAMEHGLFGLLAMGAAWHGLAAAEAADGRALPALMRGTYSVLTRVAPAGERVEESGRVGW